MPSTRVTSLDVRNAVRSLALSERPVCVHSSLRSFGWVDGGPETVIGGLLDEQCTVMVPTFTSGFQVTPPLDRRYARNGCAYDSESLPENAETGCFRTDSVQIDADMGAIPSVVVNMPGRVRGFHPSDSLTAVGLTADELIQRQQPQHVYAPFEELERRNGWVVLMGVDLTRMTLMHLAEQRAGRTLFRRWARGADGTIIEIQVGGCSEGFERLRPILAPVMRSAVVGESRWRAYPAKDVLELASAAIRLNPELTHCSDPDCIRCRDAVLGGPLIESGS